MSGKELMEVSIPPCNFSTCSSFWATPQLAPALSLGIRSLKKSLPFRSAWAMGYGEGEAEPGFLLVWLPHWVLESRELNAASFAAAELNQLKGGSPLALYPPMDLLSAMGDLHWSLSLLPA